MSLDGKIKSLIVWIVENNYCEPLSSWLPTGAHWQVDTIPLIDKISEIFEVDKQEISEFVECLNEMREKEANLSYVKVSDHVS